MPDKYHIHVEPAAPRFHEVAKLGIVDWREDCASCKNCVKKSCVYDIYRSEADALKGKGYLDYIYSCKGCLMCVQNCTKNVLTRVRNPEFNRLGDKYFTPDIVLTTWFQAETGKIPVSGSGYGGPFFGSGFDSMWTDMSEIVRPTRDGIHGREYISTEVDIGKKLNHLAFENGKLTVTSPPIISCPLPLMFDFIPEHWIRGPILGALAQVAADLGLFMAVKQKDIKGLPESVMKNIVPGIDKGADGEKYLTAPMIIIADSDNVMKEINILKQQASERIVAIRVQAGPNAAERIVEIVGQGAEVVKLEFDKHGREIGPEKPRHARDVIREVHGALVKAGTRDEMTLISSGGIALPEHMAKAIICGADLISTAIPLILALECRLCKECETGGHCTIMLEDIEPDYAVRRVTNLIGTWHSQLLELMGAMGIREARRLRGESGRGMFVEDLEAQAFGRLFGKRTTEYKI